MVNLSNSDYAALVGQRDSMAQVLAALAGVVEAHLRGDDESVPEHLRNPSPAILTMAVHNARDMLVPWFADHQ